MVWQPFQWAAVALDYPIYACEFDPIDSGKLIVGGGGGPTRTGVGNKITIIDASTPEELRVAGDVDLSRDEDSVSSLAIGHRRTTGGRTSTQVYAGVNSSAEQLRKKGRNEHLRVFAIDQTKARLSVGADTPRNKIEETSRTALFDAGADDPDTYQRLLRLSDPGAGPGAVGVVASALGKAPQIAIFDVPAQGGPKLRSVVKLEKEAEDVDIIRTGDDTFQVAYCIGYELYTINIAKGEPLEPHLVYTVPDDDAERPVIRSIRYLTSTFILAVGNLPKNAGIVLQVYRLPNHTHVHEGAPDAAHESARLSISTRIPGRNKAARVAVCNLTPPAAPQAPSVIRPGSSSGPPAPLTGPSRVGDTQFLIAVAGQDANVFLYTLEHRTAHSIELLAEFFPLCTILKEKASAAQITGVAFSVPPPVRTPTGLGKDAPRPAVTVKLAITTLDRLVSVHNVPLKKFQDKSAQTRGLHRPPRYVVAMKSRNPTLGGVISTTAIFVLIMAIAGQVFLEMWGFSRPILHARKIAPASWHRGPTVSPATDFWASLLSDVHGSSAGTPERKVVLRSEVISSADEPGLEVPVVQAEVVHPDGTSDGSKREGVEWNELSPVQKKAWKERLKEAGHWVEAQGEALFEEVLFDELAEVVGSMMM